VEGKRIEALMSNINTVLGVIANPPTQYMKEQEMQEMSDKFKPYRSVFMWYTWRAADVNISTFDEA
jgi:3-methyladenine DNA glycosylase/8-oxoguanine DNA glycosylase